MSPSGPEILRRLRRASFEPATVWQLFSRRDWPQLFPLLNVAADLPRLGANRSLAGLPREAWPQLADVARDLTSLQTLVDRPIVPEDVSLAKCHGAHQVPTAREELAATHCTNVDFLIANDRQGLLNAAVADLARERLGQWGQLEREEAPELFEIFDEALASDRFNQLTGFDSERDVYTLTLSLQDLDSRGIGWHRDLYWPKEWVGEDVFAVLYSLGTDSPEKGGAFLHYVPWTNSLQATYRQPHQATVLWNSRDDSGRLLHAVSEYHTADSSRHLIILQCLRRGA